MGLTEILIKWKFKKGVLLLILISGQSIPLHIIEFRIIGFNDEETYQ